VQFVQLGRAALGQVDVAQPLGGGEAQCLGGIVTRLIVGRPISLVLVERQLDFGGCVVPGGWCPWGSVPPLSEGLVEGGPVVRASQEGGESGIVDGRSPERAHLAQRSDERDQRVDRHRNLPVAQQGGQLARPSLETGGLRRHAGLSRLVVR